MPRHPRRLPAALGAVFTPEQARAAGVTAGRLRARDLEHPHRGLLVVTSNQSEHDDVGDDPVPFSRDRAQRAELLRRAHLYRPLMVKHAFFVGRTAGGIWGLPIDCSGDLEVGVPAPHRASRQQWRRDIEKYAAYVAHGFEVVRLTSAHIRGANPTATTIVRDVLIRRGWRP